MLKKLPALSVLIRFLGVMISISFFWYSFAHWGPEATVWLLFGGFGLLFLSLAIHHFFRKYLADRHWLRSMRHYFQHRREVHAANPQPEPPANDDTSESPTSLEAGDPTVVCPTKQGDCLVDPATGAIIKWVDEDNPYALPDIDFGDTPQVPGEDTPIQPKSNDEPYDDQVMWIDGKQIDTVTGEVLSFPADENISYHSEELGQREPEKDCPECNDDREVAVYLNGSARQAAFMPESQVDKDKFFQWHDGIYCPRTTTQQQLNLDIPDPKPLVVVFIK